MKKSQITLPPPFHMVCYFLFPSCTYFNYSATPIFIFLQLQFNLSFPPHTRDLFLSEMTCEEEVAVYKCTA